MNAPGKSTDCALWYKLKYEDHVGSAENNAHFHRSISEPGDGPRPVLLMVAKWGQNSPVCGCWLEIVDEGATMHIALGAIISGSVVQR